jgi:hypothetical protein
LQWLIEDQGCDDPHYHTSYALLLSKSAMQAFHVKSNSREKDDREIDSNVQFIFSLRERLQLFLQSSDLYDPEEVLDVIEESELWLEKVFLQFLTFLDAVTCLSPFVFTIVFSAGLLVLSSKFQMLRHLFFFVRQYYIGKWAKRTLYFRYWHCKMLSCTCFSLVVTCKFQQWWFYVKPDL